MPESGSESGSNVSDENDPDYSPQSDESEPVTIPIDRSASNTPTEQTHSNHSSISDAVQKRKRKAETDADVFESTLKQMQLRSAERHEQIKKLTENTKPLSEMQSWCGALALTLEKMPPRDLVEMKMAIGNLVGNKELEILKRSDTGMSHVIASTSASPIGFMPIENIRNNYIDYVDYPTSRTVSMSISPVTEYHYPNNENYSDSIVNQNEAPAKNSNTLPSTADSTELQYTIL